MHLYCRSTKWGWPTNVQVWPTTVENTVIIKNDIWKPMGGRQACLSCQTGRSHGLSGITSQFNFLLHVLQVEFCFNMVANYCLKTGQPLFFDGRLLCKRAKNFHWNVISPKCALLSLIFKRDSFCNPWLDKTNLSPVEQDVLFTVNSYLKTRF